MGMRKYCRAIAKERLKAMGMDPNSLGSGMSHGVHRRFQRTKHNRKIMAEVQKVYPPLWKRVLWGKYAKDAEAAQMGRSGRRIARVARTLKPAK